MYGMDRHGMNTRCVRRKTEFCTTIPVVFLDMLYYLNYPYAILNWLLKEDSKSDKHTCTVPHLRIKSCCTAFEAFQILVGRHVGAHLLKHVEFTTSQDVTVAANNESVELPYTYTYTSKQCIQTR